MLQFVPNSVERKKLRRKISKENPTYRKVLDAQRREQLRREKELREEAKKVLHEHRGTQVWVEFRDGIQKAEVIRRKGYGLVVRLVSPLQDKQGFPMKSLIGERRVGLEIVVQPGQIHHIDWCLKHATPQPSVPVVYQPGKGIGRRGGSLF
jgi:hypothetical protein